MTITTLMEGLDSWWTHGPTVHRRFRPTYQIRSFGVWGALKGFQIEHITGHIPRLRPIKPALLFVPQGVQRGCLSPWTVVSNCPMGESLWGGQLLSPGILLIARCNPLSLGAKSASRVDTRPKQKQGAV